MKKENRLVSAFRHIIALQFLLIVTITCTQVIFRYVFNNSLVWSEELVRFLVIWMCMIGAAVSCYDDSHMMIDSFITNLGERIQFVMYTVRQLLIIVFSILASLSSFKLIEAAWSTKSGALGISMGLWRMSGTVGLLLVVIFTIMRYVKDFKRFKNHKFVSQDVSNDY